MNEEDMECKVIASLMIMLDDKFSNEAKIQAMKDVKKIFEKQQKEIESYKERYENMKWYFDNQEDNLIHKNRIKEKIKLLKDIKKANCYKQLTEDYLKGAIEQLEELLGE